MKFFSSLPVIFIRIVKISILAILLPTFFELAKAPIPMVPMGAMSVRGAISGLSGLSDFVTGIKSVIGKPGEFADMNQFDYNHIYNAILQYSVVQAYQQAETNKLLNQQSTYNEKVYNELGKIFITQIVLIGALLINAALPLKNNNIRADQNIMLLGHRLKRY